MQSDIQLDLIDLKPNSVLKTTFDEFFSASEICFWRPLPCLNFSEIKTSLRVIRCFGTTLTCELAFSSMILIENKTRSHLTDSNLKNSLLLLVTNVTPLTTEELLKSKQTQRALFTK